MKIINGILTIINYALMIAPCVVVGILAAESADVLVADDNIGMELIIMSALILVEMVFYYLHIILHEGGHLICGLITGWKFSSFRIASIALVKQDGKLKWKKTTVAGTGGQCLMIPPETDYEKCPFFLYLLGGGLINIVTGAIALAVGLLVGGLAQTILIMFAVTGFCLGLSNLIPAKMSGTANDGYQIFIEMPADPKSKKYMCCLLTANAVLTENESTRALPEKIRDTILNSDYSDLSNSSIANLYCFKAVILQEEGRYEKCREVYQNIADNMEVLQIFKNEAKCELIYHEIMGECNAEKIDALYDKKQAEYIKVTSLYPSRRRLMYAYHLIYKNDSAKADEEYNALLKAAKTHPSKAESVIELKEAERVRELYESKRNLS